MTKKKSILRRVLVTVLVAVAVACAGFVWWASDCYRAGETAASMVTAGMAGSQGGAAVAVEEGSSWIAVGDSGAETGLVFYPGAKVDPAAYVPLAANLAERGVFCVIVKMPLNFAFFNIGAADSVMAAYPGVTSWWIGGHSLGGAMAASYAEGNAGKFAGVALLAAYGSENLAATGLRVEVVYGSNDGVVNRESLAKCVATLPAGWVCEIAGGNHAGFADYGPQDGDGEATISAEEQRQQTADALLAAMGAA